MNHMMKLKRGLVSLDLSQVHVQVCDAMQICFINISAIVIWLDLN